MKQWFELDFIIIAFLSPFSPPPHPFPSSYPPHPPHPLFSLPITFLISFKINKRIILNIASLTNLNSILLLFHIHIFLLFLPSSSSYFPYIPPPLFLLHLLIPYFLIMYSHSHYSNLLVSLAYYLNVIHD